MISTDAAPGSDRVNLTVKGPEAGLGITPSSAKRPAEAVSQLTAAVELNPRYAEAHNNLGNAYLQNGQVAEAIAEFKTALDLKPNIANARENLDRALRQQGRPPGAR